METTKYKGYLIDKEREDYTNKVIYVIWDKKGIIYLNTVDSLDKAKKYIDTL